MIHFISIYILFYKLIVWCQETNDSFLVIKKNICTSIFLLFYHGHTHIHKCFIIILYLATELVFLNIDIVVGKIWKLFNFFTFILWFTFAFILNIYNEYFKIFNHSILLIQTCSDITRIYVFLFSSPCRNKCFIFITWVRCDVISLSPRKRRTLLILFVWP